MVDQLPNNPDEPKLSQAKAFAMLMSKTYANRLEEELEKNDVVAERLAGYRLNYSVIEAPTLENILEQEIFKSEQSLEQLVNHPIVISCFRMFETVIEKGVIEEEYIELFKILEELSLGQVQFNHPTLQEFGITDFHIAKANLIDILLEKYDFIENGLSRYYSSIGLGFSIQEAQVKSTYYAAEAVRGSGIYQQNYNLIIEGLENSENTDYAKVVEWLENQGLEITVTGLKSFVYLYNVTGHSERKAQQRQDILTEIQNLINEGLKRQTIIEIISEEFDISKATAENYLQNNNIRVDKIRWDKDYVNVTIDNEIILLTYGQALDYLHNQNLNASRDELAKALSELTGREINSNTIRVRMSRTKNNKSSES